MDTNVNYTAVGAFIIILFAAIVLGIIWLSSGLSLDRFTTYEVFMEESVAGLTVDSPVEYNGVAVGTVTSIQLDRRNPNLVRLLLNLKVGTPITRGTVATLNTRGLTGVAYVALKDNGTDLTPLVAETGQTYPIIKTAPSLFSRLDTGLEKINTSLYKLSTAVQSILDQENQQAFKAILLNLNKFTEVLSNQSEKLSLIIDNTARATSDFPALIHSTQSAVQTISKQTLPSADRAMTNINDASQNLLEITNEIKDNPSVLIRGKATGTLGPGER